MRNTKLLTSLATATVAVGSFAPVALAGGTDHRGTRTICVKSAWVERAPASHPIGLAWKGDRFRVTRAAYATVHHSDGTTQRWAKGRLTHHDKKSGKTFRASGWIRVTALGSTCGA